MDVLLVDDHALFRAGLKLLLEVKRPDLRVHEAVGATAAMAWVQDHGAPDLCLLDLELKDHSGMLVLRAIRTMTPHAAIVVISATDDPSAVCACIQAGAMSYIPKSASSEVLAQAIARVLAGEVFLPEGFKAADPDRQAPSPVLTPRQRDVLRLLNRGLPSKLIARELGISEYTVKDHIASILRILGVRNRTQAVILARRLTLHDPG
jgi:DNA-binding NarL/FixJ family response regulator